MEDTESSWRRPLRVWCRCYSGLDPMEDTERADETMAFGASASSYSGLDPMEDTERESWGVFVGLGFKGYSGLDPMEEGWRSPDCLR